jgi:membrane-associated phospholipid phosphatase
MDGRHLFRIVTDFGDQGVILPLVGLIAVGLLVLGERRAALWWCLAIAVSLGGAFVAKFVFIPCGHLVPGLDLRSPSGHMAAATAAYGGLAVLVAKAARRRQATAIALVLAALAALAIGLTRVILAAHTASETVVGGAIGLAAPLILAIPRDLIVRRLTLKSAWLLLVPLALILAFHGVELSLESRIDLIARDLAESLGVCG